MALRAIHQNICLEMTGKPWSVMTPDANNQGFCFMVCFYLDFKVYFRLFVKKLTICLIIQVCCYIKYEHYNHDKISKPHRK